MTKGVKTVASDPEFGAYQVVFATLVALDATARARVLRYVAEKLDIAPSDTHRTSLRTDDDRPDADQPDSPAKQPPATPAEPSSADDGISPIAKKWIHRNSLAMDGLTRLFSVGGEEIDLIADKVPGTSKRGRLHQVLLLKAIAAYLGTGVARVADQQLREVASHYDANDEANFSTNLKGYDSMYSGTKQSGYTLNARGLAAAATLIKEMLAGAAAKMS